MENSTHNEGVLAVMQNLSESMIQLIGFSFMLGSLFTVLMLLVLDFIRRNRPKED